MDLLSWLNTENAWWAATILLYLLADRLSVRLGRRAWLHPALLPVILLLGLFGSGAFDYEPFREGTASFSLLLSLAVIALGVPLYRSWGLLKGNRRAALAALAGGSVAGVGTALLFAKILGGDAALLASLATKSVTTPIAVEVTASIGGLPPIAAAVVVVTGMVAAIVGPLVLKLAGIDGETASGLALGTAGHGIGTAEATRLSETMGAAAAFAMTVNGLATAVLLPLIWG